MRALAIRSILLAQLITLAGSWAAAGEGPPSSESKDPMAHLLAALRVEEARYQDLEYLIRTTTRIAALDVGAAADEFTVEQTRDVVFQGDRVFYRGVIDDRSVGTAVHQTVVSAYDGEKTRTVIAGNCVNIHTGRFEHPDVLPAHCVSLLHYQLNFPLSVYLTGTDAIHGHPKYGRYPSEGGGSIYEFTKVVAHYAGEELVDGLRCVKIRCDHWNSIKNPPFLQYLWLAPDRNYLCVKETVAWPGSRFGNLPLHQMRVEKFREASPGRWFPSRISVEEYDPAALEQHKQVIHTVRTSLVPRVNLEPRREPAFFHDIELPPDLPFFTLENGKLVGPKILQPLDDSAGNSKRKEVVARIQEEEARFAHLEVKAHGGYKFLGIDELPSAIMEKLSDEHSAFQGKLAFFSGRARTSFRGEAPIESVTAQAFDGRWLRTYRGFKHEAEDAGGFASLQDRGDGKVQGRLDGVWVHHPHTLLMRGTGIYGPLADFVVSPWFDIQNSARQRFSYCGEQEFEGHRCIVLRSRMFRLAVPSRDHSTAVFWLDTDRNFIPRRIEWYSLSDAFPSALREIDVCNDLRELTPGVWYPWHARQMGINSLAMMQGFVRLDWRQDLQIETVSLSLNPGRSLFRELVVPTGILVEVTDRQNKRVRRFVQPKEGNLEANPTP